MAAKGKEDSDVPATPTVDVHHHSIPAGLVQAVRNEGARFGATVDTLPDGRERMILSDRSRMLIGPEHHDEVVRQRELAKLEIEVGLKSILPTVLYYEAGREAAKWYAQAVNDAIADDASASSGKVLGMAHVPLQFPELAAKELERTVQEYRFPSVQIGSNANGKNLDEPELDAFWEAAQALDVLVFVHPTNVAGADRLKHYWLKNLIGNPLDTSIAVASIIFGGVLDRYPRLKFVFAHSGGYAPWIRGRWRHGQEVREEAKARGVTRPLDEYFAQLYFDTVIHDEKALRYLVDSVGADRVVHGTDYPADMGDMKQVAWIRGLPWLTQDQKADILGRTALRLIGRAILSPAAAGKGVA
jgi:aminocarboxymuconate-semialdehyde decarboxylase